MGFGKLYKSFIYILTDKIKPKNKTYYRDRKNGIWNCKRPNGSEHEKKKEEKLRKYWVFDDFSTIYWEFVFLARRSGRSLKGSYLRRSSFLGLLDLELVSQAEKTRIHKIKKQLKILIFFFWNSCLNFDFFCKDNF